MTSPPDRELYTEAEAARLLRVPGPRCAVGSQDRSEPSGTTGRSPTTGHPQAVP
nr:hypothetical protein [Micromonospora sp. DSM 115978]